MTNEEKIKYLSQSFSILEQGYKIKTYNQALLNEHFSKLPNRLFKYCKVNNYSLESLTTGQIYLAPMDEMDDPFECSTNLDVFKLYDKEKNSITNMAFDSIVAQVIQYANPAEREQILYIIKDCKMPNNTINRSKLLEALTGVHVGIVPDDIVLMINLLANLPEQLFEPNNTANFEKLIKMAPAMRQDLGIYAMSEDRDNQVLWAMYTNNYRGICIEYDFENEVNLVFHTLPVIYQKERSNNAISLMLEDFINGFIYNFTQGNITPERFAYMKLMLTKNIDWEFQHEWRIIGDAKQKVKAPKVNAIYLGNKCNRVNKKKILSIAETRKIPVFKQIIDIENLSFNYEQII